MQLHRPTACASGAFDYQLDEFGKEFLRVMECTSVDDHAMTL